MSSTIWLTDRSRYTTGTGRCARERYLTNHAGPTGYGIVRKGESLPLMTGSYTHLPLERLYQYLQKHDQFPTREVIREAIAEGCTEYDKRIAERGFRGLLQSERTDTIVKEQQYLIAGLIWAACKTVLPWIHTNYRIIQTELESIYVLDCTCGLGSAVLDVAAHEAKDCQGIGQMLRQDAVAQKRVGNTLAYFEAKTTGWGGDNWAPQWETKPQLALGNLGLKERYGQDVSENFIVALQKGSRKTSKPKDAFEEAVTRQESPFCYGYCSIGNPPLSADDWRHTYDYIDEKGQSRRVTRAHQKRGVWELEQSDWPKYHAAKAADPSLTPIEIWLQTMPQDAAESQVYLIGPLNRQDVQIESLKRQVVGEERKWQRILWDLHTLTKLIWHDRPPTAPLDGWAYVWSHEMFQRRLDDLIPASWECRRFGVKHECQDKMLCFKETNWEDPLSVGLFVPRRPHHRPELDQAVERGLLPAETEEAEEDD